MASHVRSSGNTIDESPGAQTARQAVMKNSDALDLLIIDFNVVEATWGSLSGILTSADPTFTMTNTDAEDTDAGRQSIFIFKGTQSGSEVTTLASIRAQHDGAADDQKGDIIMATNDGSDADSPTERLRIDSAGLITITGTLTVSSTTTFSGNTTTSNTAPEHVFINTTAEDGDGGRESILRFKGTQSGAEVTTLATIQGSHDGAADDQKGDLIFSTNDGSDSDTPTERLRIDSAGRVLVGDNTSRVIGGVGSKLQINGDSLNADWANDANASTIYFSKSRSTTPGSYTIVQDNDLLGTINWFGDDGNDLGNAAAKIFARVNGTPGSNDMPTELVFSTTADGAAASTERMIINAAGAVGLGETDPDCSAGGICLNQGSADTAILTMKNSDVDHGLISIAETNTFFLQKKNQPAGGGSNIKAITDGGETAAVAYQVQGYLRDTANTSTTTGAVGVVSINSHQHDGADTVSAVAAAGNIFVARNNDLAAVIFKGDGDIEADGTVTSGSFDFAEYFESASGEAIPAGTTVKLINDKIAPCLPGDIPMGVISETACFIGNKGLEWGGKYQRDEHGGFLMKTERWVKWFEDYEKEPAKTEVEEVQKVVGTHEIPIMESKKTIIDAVMAKRLVTCKANEAKNIPFGAVYYDVEDRILNPDYDPEQEYISRADRSEWNIVGLLGQINIKKGQPTNPNWIKMIDLNDNFEKWLVR